MNYIPRVIKCQTVDDYLFWHGMLKDSSNKPEMVLVKLPVVKLLAGASKTKVYEMIKEGSLPGPSSLSSKRDAYWNLEEVNKAIADALLPQ